MLTHSIFCWLSLWKPVIDTGLQALLVIASSGLLWASLAQAKAADTLKEAAREQIAQGIAARRPFLSIVHPHQREDALLVNYGPGNAFKVTWQFMKPERFREFLNTDAIGSMGTGTSIPVIFTTPGLRVALTLELISAEGGVRIDYQDFSGKRYWSTVTRAPEGHLLVETDGKTLAPVEKKHWYWPVARRDQK